MQLEAGEVAVNQGKLDELLMVDDVVQLHIGRVDLDGVGGDLESLSGVADFKLDRLDVLLIDVQDDACGREGFESRGADCDAVGSDRELREEIVAGGEALSGVFDAGGQVGGRDRSARVGPHRRGR